MEIAMIYIVVHSLIVLMVIAAVILTVILIVKSRKKTAGRGIAVTLAAVLIMAGSLSVWSLSHRAYPGVNDWSFIGRDIGSVEQRYGGFERIVTEEDGSGYAVLRTEKIVGHDMYDSNDYTNYHMEFDQNGKITGTWCERPLGG
ncbi:MAG: hypothetical protein J5685_02860 [Clostridiales bacterium]|nr:hypothetical protein [Clostridiales bacterium]